ncbi:hypothetical protein, partial [Klebsiella michiganensis]|uniref:hypothetical protein n=1 Tax=Klebsiella michiganensis TaxID=1134687 RepID=UPI000C9B0B7F
FSAASSRAALRLPGLRGHGCLRVGSSGKAFTPQSGEYAGIEALVRLRPGPRCACPGYGATAVCGPVARVRRLRRNPGSTPGLRLWCGFFPGRAALARATGPRLSAGR